MKSLLKEMQNHQTQLERIFVYYCSFADKQNLNSLKIQNYRRLLLDMQIPIPQNLKSQTDLIFFTHAQHTALDYDTFVSTLIDLSVFVFQGQDKKSALQKLLIQHIQPLYDVILKQTQFGQSLGQISVQLFTQSCFIFLKRFQSGLVTIYKQYFRGQGSKGKEEQFKMLSKLSRDLTLIPRVANKPLSYLIYSFLRQRQSHSAFQPYFGHGLTANNKIYKFSFICFLQYLIILSCINFRTQQKQQIKLYRLLQFIEVSPGCQKIYKKIKMQHFFMTQQQLQTAIHLQNIQILYNNTPSKHMVTSLPSKASSQTPQKRKLLGFHDKLKNKFAQLCGKKSVQTNFYLSQAKTKQLILAICPKLTHNVVDMIVDSFQRINFDSFIAILEAVAQRLHTTAQFMYQQVLLYNTSDYSLSFLLENVKLTPKQDSFCREMLKITHAYLRSIFEYFQTSKGLNISAYLKLLEEMSVLPQIVKPKEANDLFKVCCKNANIMTLQQFEQSLLGITIAIRFECNLEGPQRLVYLLEKMCESKRGQIFMKKNFLMVKQHPLYLLRLTFGDIYQQIERKLEEVNSYTSSQHEMIKNIA